MKTRVITLIVLFAFAGSLQAATNVKIASFNAKSNPDTDVNLLANQVEDLTREEGIDIWVFQEVDGWEAASTLKDGAMEGGPNSARWMYLATRFVMDGPGGRPDLLAIAFRSDMFTLLETTSLNSIMIKNNGAWNHRMRPMFALKLRSKSEDEEFWVATVHLKCCGNGVLRRQLQAERITPWVAEKGDTPVLILGDFNIPIPVNDPGGASSSIAFNHLVGAMNWLRPTNPTATQVQGSMLDAAFHANLDSWQPSAEVLLANEDLSILNNSGFSDHRPILVEIRIP